MLILTKNVLEQDYLPSKMNSVGVTGKSSQQTMEHKDSVHDLVRQHTFAVADDCADVNADAAADVSVNADADPCADADSDASADADSDAGADAGPDADS